MNPYESPLNPSESSDSATPASPGNGDDIRVNCVACGANVARIPLGAACRTCGTPVAVSVRSRKTVDPGHGLALASTICSAVGIGACAIGLPVGLGLGIAALRRYKREGGTDSTRILAKIGIWIGGIGSLAIGGLVIFGVVVGLAGAARPAGPAPVGMPPANPAPIVGPGNGTAAGGGPGGGMGATPVAQGGATDAAGVAGDSGDPEADPEADPKADSEAALEGDDGPGR